MSPSKTNIQELYPALVSESVTRIHWGDLTYTEDYEFWEASECSECGKIVNCYAGEEKHCHIDDDSDCQGYLYAEGPIYYEFYPLGNFIDDPAEKALKIAHLPLCITYVNQFNQYGLSLTGCGMNLCWEICEAYVCLGYLPPFDLCDLPRMAGRGTSERDCRIIEACKRSASFIINQAKSKIHDLERFKEAA